MFSFFKKNKNPQLKSETKVWLNWQAKYQGFIKEVKQLRQEQKSLMITAFFSRTIYELEEILKNQQLEFQKLESPNGPVQLQNIILVPAEVIHSMANQGKIPFAVMPDYILIPERYPIFSPEKQLLENLHKLSPTSKAIFHFDLDDPLMQAFGSDRLKSLMAKLGLKESESIAHAMVTKSIQRAQQKLESDIHTEIKTESAKDWFAQNKPI